MTEATEMKFELHTIETAPEAVRPELEAAQQMYGSIPNLYRGLATNPATLKIYLQFSEMLQAYGCLSPIEQQVVYITVSAEHVQQDLLDGCLFIVVIIMISGAIDAHSLYNRHSESLNMPEVLYAIPSPKVARSVRAAGCLAVLR